MLLADTQIQDLIDDAESGLVIEPFDRDQLQGASYDLHVGKRLLISGLDREIDLSERGSAAVPAGDFAVVVTQERFEIPQDMAVNIGPKTYLTKKGIILQAGMQIDPGFKGHLVLGLYNSSPRKFVVEHLGDLCSIQFFKLKVAAKKTIATYPEYLSGEFPREMKDYLYSLETKSLTSLGEDVRTLTKNVGALSSEFAAVKTLLYALLVPVAVGVVLLAAQALFKAG